MRQRDVRRREGRAVATFPDMPFGLGIWEILILAGVLVLLFGAKGAPAMARRLGTGVREMKDAVADMDPRSLLDPKDAANAPAPRRELTAAPAPPPAPSMPAASAAPAEGAPPETEAPGESGSPAEPALTEDPASGQPSR